MDTRPATLKRFRAGLMWPWRTWRERISLQMIISYLAMVLLVLILFEATVLGSILLNPGDRFFTTQQVTIDPYLGERSAAYVQWLGPEEINDTINTVPRNPWQLAQLNGQLSDLAQGSVPAFPRLSPVSDGESALILILNTQGQIVASSDAQIPISTPIDRLPTQVRGTVLRNQNLAGAEDEQWNALYTLSLFGERTVVAHPIITSDGDWAGTFVMEGGSVSFALGQTRGEFFRQISVVFLQSLWIFAIPAVIVAVPFGIWRASTISRRIERLADAAEMMAQGALNTRVRVRKRDEIGRLGESFNAMAEQIDANDRARRAFISNVSHELRTPISIIMGHAEQLQGLPQAREESISRSLSTIQVEGEMLVRLVEDLFTSARLQESNLKMHCVRLSLADAIREVLEGIQRSAWHDRKISVESVISPDLPPVVADKQRLQQIISNLVYNALRHTPEGGLVVARAEQQGNQVEVSIIDSGLGMDDATARFAFDRYYQSERYRRHSEGTGLGLSIVQQLVEAHGGRIWVTSRVGEGTTFTFTLPVA
jgi:signal transduction histidine kinase